MVVAAGVVVVGVVAATVAVVVRVVGLVAAAARCARGATMDERGCAVVATGVRETGAAGAAGVTAASVAAG